MYSQFVDGQLNDFVASLKEPFQFIAMLLSTGQYLLSTNLTSNPLPIYNPILFDASCNGIQHLAAMTKDVELAKKTNLISLESNNDKAPEDLYSYAADLVQSEIDSLTTGAKNLEGTIPLTGVRITRAFIKKSVMTIPYNISLSGVQEQIMSHFTQYNELGKRLYRLPKEFTKGDEDLLLTWSEVMKLGALVYTVLNRELPSLKNLKKYLGDMSSLILKLGLWVYWINPTGIKVNLSTVKMDKHVLWSRLYTGNKPITISLPTKDLDKVAIRRSLMPNLIHSLDAANIQLFVNKLDSDIPFYTIHDCFASLPNNMQMLESKVKEAFIEIYFSGSNYVKVLHQYLIKQIKSGVDENAIYTKDDGNEYIMIEGTSKVTEVMIPTIPSTFTDSTKIDMFVREWDTLKFYYLKGLDGNWDISKIENTYNFPNIEVTAKTTTLDTNFGSLDLETLAVSEKGLQRTYAGGWTNGQVSHRFIAQDINDPIITTLINSIFDYIRIKEDESKVSQGKRNGMTLWAHNLGRFDSVELIKGLLDVSPENNPYEIKTLFKSEEGKVLSLTITEKESRNYIVIKDSISFFNFMSLDDVYKSHNIDYVKGHFPHTWVSSHRLNYIGDVPSRSYFGDSITDIEYNNLVSPWDFRKELDKYLEADVNGLYKAVSDVHMDCFERYKLNMTDFLTLPSLAKAIYTSNYYNEDHEIKVIKGVVESEIRSAYYGGMVQNLAPKEVITKGEAYDMNSQYPNSMLQDMPVGNPTFTDEKDLDKLFGFTYGKVIPPRDLKVLLIRDRQEGSGIAIYPRTPLKRMIFTEEIREALKYGYQFEVEYSYNYKRGVDVFADYVNIHYKDKKEATDPTRKSTSKLLLNSLYGKFGTKDIESTMKVITRSAAKAITKFYNYDFVSAINDHYTVVKYRSRISERLRKLYSGYHEERAVKHTAKSLSKVKHRGVQSSISIAAAIGGYSAASMFKYMNIPDNPLLYIDTDGVVLTNPLEDTASIGPNLGQMKHEYRGGKYYHYYCFKKSSGPIWEREYFIWGLFKSSTSWKWILFSLAYSCLYII